MKSSIQILIIFCISQSVFSENNGKIDENSFLSDIFNIFRLFNIDEKCKTVEIATIVSKSEINEYIYTLQHLNCSDTTMISKVKTLSIELNSLFSECIDPKYIKIVNKLYELYSKFLKLRCEMSDVDDKVMQEISGAKHDCRKKVQFHLLKCYFSEEELIQISQNVSSAANFTLDLIRGNDKECGVVNRIGKCILKSMRICDSKTNSKQIEYYLNILMKAVNCKFDETVDISDLTISEPLRNEDLSDTLINAVRNCKLEERQDLLEITSEIYSQLSSKNDTQDFKNNFKMICELKKKDKYKSIITKSTLTLEKCVDPHYVNHVQKLEIVAKRSVDVICNTNDELLSFVKYIMEEPKDICSNSKESAFQIYGCVFSQVEVRELMDDRSMISNFTLELLDGTDKKCVTSNKIQMCVLESLQRCDDKLLLNNFKLLSDMVLEIIHCKIHDVMVQPVDHSFVKSMVIIITIVIMMIIVFAFVIIRKKMRIGELLLLEPNMASFELLEQKDL